MFSRHQYHRRIFSMNNVEEPSGPSQNPSRTIMLRHDLPSLGHVRSSYSCSFCKRGFSNAQALGGHMNIHRKDRAKLIDDQGNSSTEIKEVTDDGTVVTEDHSPQAKTVSTSREDCRADDCDEDGDDDAGNEVQFFKDLGIVRSSINSSEESEIDLELRLGPEPRDSLKSKK